MSPPFATVKTAMPFSKAPTVVAFCDEPLAFAWTPLVPALAPAAAVIAVALVPASNSNVPFFEFIKRALVLEEDDLAIYLSAGLESYG